MKHLGILLLAFALTSSAKAQVEKVVKASNQFAFDFYKQKSDTLGNLFFSPFSIESALSMTAVGAQKQTLAQMMQVLHLPQEYQRDFKMLLGQLKENKNYQLLIANRLWGPTGEDYLPNFLSSLKENYTADLVSLDFKKQPEESRGKINSWVKDKTNGKILDLLPPGGISPATILVLTNAVYFKAIWKKTFNKSDTVTAPFIGENAKTETIPFMKMHEHFRYAQKEDIALLEMPFQNEEVVIDILLPSLDAELSVVDKKISEKRFSEMIALLNDREVHVSLPKFKFETSYNLGETLAKMGMPLAFDTERANFQGIRKILANENIFISSVIHKAFCEVNEEGSEAAAATAVLAVGGAAPGPKLPPIVEFKADHPFLFFIRHLKSGAILFMGRFSS